MFVNLGNFNSPGIPNLGNLGNFDGKPPEMEDHKWANLSAEERWKAQVEYNAEAAAYNFGMLVKQVQMHHELMVSINSTIMAICRMCKIAPEQLDKEANDQGENQTFISRLVDASKKRQGSEQTTNKNIGNLLSNEGNSK